MRETRLGPKWRRSPASRGAAMIWCGSRPERPSELMKHKVIVIGGGVIGLCCAYYAARRGLDVTILDSAAAEDTGCSHGNAGLVVPSHFVPLASPGAIKAGLRMLLNPESPFYIKPRANLDLARWLWRFVRSSTDEHARRSAPVLRDLNMESRACYEALAREGLDFGLVQSGVFMVCATEHALLEEAEVAKRARALGLEAEVLDAADTTRRDPALAENIAGAVHYPQDCHLVPERFLAGLRTRLSDLGGHLMWRRPVTGWRTQGGRLQAVETPSGLVEGDSFVIAGGAWSAPLARQLGVQVPLEAGRGYSLTLDTPQVRPRSAALCVEARIAVTPMGNGVRFAGTMELAGLEPAVNPTRVRGMTRSIPRYYPGLADHNFADVAVWSGLRPCSPDGLPYIGQLSSFENTIVATGHSMMGLSLGPVTGKIIGQLLSGEPTSVAIDMLRPDRFA